MRHKKRFLDFFKKTTKPKDDYSLEIDIRPPYTFFFYPTSDPEQAIDMINDIIERVSSLSRKEEDDIRELYAAVLLTISEDVKKKRPKNVFEERFFLIRVLLERYGDKKEFSYVEMLKYVDVLPRLKNWTGLDIIDEAPIKKLLGAFLSDLIYYSFNYRNVRDKSLKVFQDEDEKSTFEKLMDGFMTLSKINIKWINLGFESDFYGIDPCEYESEKIKADEDGGRKLMKEIFSFHTMSEIVEIPVFNLFHKSDDDKNEGDDNKNSLLSFMDKNNYNKPFKNKKTKDEEPEKTLTKEERSIERIKRFMDDWSVKGMINHVKTYVSGQDVAINMLCRAIYEHMYLIIHPEKHLRKKSYVIFGPTGCGKTEMFRVLSKVLPVDVHIVNASAITPSGYKGSNIDELINDLKNSSKYWFEHSIIFFDEFDKLCNLSGDADKDAFLVQKQSSVLKIIEGTTISTESKGLASWLSSSLESDIDTTNILFFCGGAFSGAFKTENTRTVGFTSLTSNEKKNDVISALIEFGMMPELAGRITSIIPVKALERDDLIDIIQSEYCSPLTDVKEIFKGVYNVKIIFEDEAIDKVCELSLGMQLGARSLHSILNGAAQMACGEQTDTVVSVTAQDVMRFMENYAIKECYSRKEMQHL